MKKPMKKPSNPSNELERNLGIPAYKKQPLDDGMGEKKEHKKKGKCNCNCKK